MTSFRFSCCSYFNKRYKRFLTLVVIFITCFILLRLKMKELQRRKVQKLHKQVLKENRDQFLEVVLKEVSFNEVNLLEMQMQEKEIAENDKAIEEDEEMIVPGLGEGGIKAQVPLEYEALVNETLKNETFNRILSQLISMTRSIPDMREQACKEIAYSLNKLPAMSIIVILKNEVYSVLIRMIHGIFLRTPANLFKEIILVDDFSSNKDLVGKLERYLATRIPEPEKIRLVRLHSHQGLIRARMIGAHLAIGDTLMFIDAHCEVGRGWAEPLLERVKEDRTVVVTPIIDSIDEKTLEYEVQTEGHFDTAFYLGGFKWTGHFDWIPIPEREKKRKGYKSHLPMKSPTMAGGLFAIDRKYFWEIGSYDPGMKVWGGENLEMSFRIWQCGGSIEVIPCSRIGHIYRSQRPYNYTVDMKTDNLARVAEVWMDDYRNLLLKNQFFKPKNVGDVSARQKFRIHLDCQSFHWYLDKVYPEKFKMEYDSKLYGKVKNVGLDKCLHYFGTYTENATLELKNCSDYLYAVSQEFFLSKTGQLRKELVCVRHGDDDTKVEMNWCEQLKPENESYVWEYDVNSKHLLNAESERCLEARRKEKNIATEKSKVEYDVLLGKCDKNSENQKWEIIPKITLAEDYEV